MEPRQITLRHSSLDIDGGIATFTHQQPASRNAFTDELRADYFDMLGHIEQDRSVRVLILTGSGGSFSAGGDLKSIRRMQESADPGLSGPEQMARRIRTSHQWLRRLRNLDVPVIAAVDGPAAGAGFSLALAADFVLASERAFFTMSFAKIGLVPDMGALYELPRLVGTALARELMYTGRRLGASEAKAAGLVYAVHPADALADAALQFARRFVEASPSALSLTKRLLNRSLETSYETMLELESQVQGVAAGTTYHADAIAGFLQGKPAPFDWDRSR
jgi:2-(1,2-epoxy-1,2-dihydrophenyl)acetyl-CoA isomerase